MFCFLAKKNKIVCEFVESLTFIYECYFWKWNHQKCAFLAWVKKTIVRLRMAGDYNLNSFFFATDDHQLCAIGFY